MFSELAKKYIEEKFEIFKDTHPFFKPGHAIKWNNHLKEVYLSNVKFLLLQTGPNLVFAAQKADAANNQKLKSFYIEKYKEEDGHAAWADQDAENTNLTLSSEQVTSEMKDLTNYILSVINNNYTQYIFYILAVEYLTVLASPYLFEKLKAFNEQRSDLTVIAHHEELDRHHIKDDFKAIDDFFENSTNNIQAQNEITDKTIELLSKFYMLFVETKNVRIAKPMEA